MKSKRLTQHTFQMLLEKIAPALCGKAKNLGLFHLKRRPKGDAFLNAKVMDRGTLLLNVGYF